jgi:hypothetical protein
MEHERHTPSFELVEQAPMDGGCTANSLVNLTSIILKHDIPRDELTDLRRITESNRVQQGREGLTARDKIAFLEEHGLRYEYLGDTLAQFADDSNEFLAEVLRRLHQSPMSLLYHRH